MVRMEERTLEFRTFCWEGPGPLCLMANNQTTSMLIRGATGLSPWTMPFPLNMHDTSASANMAVTVKTIVVKKVHKKVATFSKFAYHSESEQIGTSYMASFSKDERAAECMLANPVLVYHRTW